MRGELEEAWHCGRHADRARKLWALAMHSGRSEAGVGIRSLPATSHCITSTARLSMATRRTDLGGFPSDRAPGPVSGQCSSSLSHRSAGSESAAAAKWTGSSAAETSHALPPSGCSPDAPPPWLLSTTGRWQRRLTFRREPFCPSPSAGRAGQAPHQIVKKRRRQVMGDLGWWGRERCGSGQHDIEVWLWAT